MELSFGQIDLKQEAAGREKIYFGIILFLIVVMFARWFYIPKMKQIKMLKVDIKNNAMQIGTLKQFAQLKIPEPAASRAGEPALKGGTKFEKAVEESMRSPQQVVADVVRSMTSNTALGGMTLSGTSFGAEVNKGAFTEIPVGLNLTGRYSGVLNYLERMEKIGKLVTVDNIEIKADEKSSSIINAKLLANIYVVNSAPNMPSGQAGNVVQAQGAPAAGASTPAQQSGQMGGPSGK